MNKLFKKALTLFAVASIGAVMMGAAPANTVNNEMIPAIKLVEATQRPLLIQGAMDVETEIMMAALENPEDITLGVWKYTTGTLNGYPVVISRTRIGMVNAAASTTLAIEHFNPVAIINQGTAGGHDPELHKYDIVLGKEVVNMGAFKTDFTEKSEGIHPTTWKPMTLEIVDNQTGEWTEVGSFPADEALLAAANSVKDTHTKGKVVEGTVGSADEWNKEIDRILWLNETLGTSAEEMETAAAAQIAATYDIPFLSIRILSNNEVHKEAYDRTTGEDSQAFTLQVAKAYIDNYLLVETEEVTTTK
ncbi:5'-methylthioadenosine/S-adenosylhomocysteine nucleosidase [Niameybacter massiliensis]|uniref:5'-methylthioadenosine/S-adenosylhomocysteine nucleosidase n=1 Tax=Holtiella tumoricola TaxID=3018743 RepID=A0AA42IZ86_9FIRM|nr:5'-methylthioadenosine/S-adenosylhomocysteine nucleosidase [Holtiella tumoricola]MDA3730156.1 5'-methylthioadenosine/S-adenosylhomocysteine nucleosidase [Holtiella tumoricola]